MWIRSCDEVSFSGNPKCSMLLEYLPTCPRKITQSWSHVGQYSPWFFYGNHGEWDFYKASWVQLHGPGLPWPNGPRSQPLASPCHTLQRLREAQRLRARWSRMDGCLTTTSGDKGITTGQPTKNWDTAEGLVSRYVWYGWWL